VDRCALFVDAGYVLADGAMAVHGTRHRESVSWDYAGLLQFFGSIARERTGLPLLRCYWYEATVEGRRSAEHDALADMPGLKLRLGRMRPGRREGVESEIHRDLTTLARNGGVSDALVVSAEEDLAQVVADVQDLGVRVTMVHITVDGNWTISRGLRQECDDIVEIGDAHLRPFVELIAGAEPMRDDEQYPVGAFAGRALTNGHGSLAGSLGHQQALPAGSHQGPPAIYTAPVVAEYQRSVQPPANSHPAPLPHRESGPMDRPAPQPQVMQNQGIPNQGMQNQPGLQNQGMQNQPGIQNQGMQNQPGLQIQQSPPVAQGPSTMPGLPSAQSPSGVPGPPVSQGQHSQQGMPGPSGAPGQLGAPGQRGPSAPGQPGLQIPPGMPGQPGVHAQSGMSRGSHGLQSRAEEQNIPAASQQMYPAPTAAQFRPAQDVPMGQGAAGPRPTMPGQGAPGGPGAPGGQGLHNASRPYQPGPYAGAPHDQSGPGQFPGGPPGQQEAANGVSPYMPQQGPYSGPQSAAPLAPVPQPVTVSLADAVQSAHSEGFEFGQSVAREAPALWLEAVLARKPRMPSDLEARLLQDSALPIDSLLHDEVRHALRRGFWDALERSRR
jgi:NYN domain